MRFNFGVATGLTEMVKAVQVADMKVQKGNILMVGAFALLVGVLAIVGWLGVRQSQIESAMAQRQFLSVILLAGLLAIGIAVLSVRGISQEIIRREGAEQSLRHALDTLELRVRERSAELEQANTTLRRLAAIVESSDDAIISKTTEGIITTWNQGAEKLFGYLAGEAVGKPITILFPPERENEEPELLAQIRRGKKVDHFETERVCKGGKRIYVSVTISPIRDGDGKVIGASKIARDITARKRAEAEIRQLNASLEQRVRERTARLEAVNQELETFSYSVSHDLRAPLRAIDGFAQILVEDHAAQVGPEGQRVLRVISEEILRMGELIDDLLAFSQLGRQTMETVIVNMTGLADKVARELSAANTNRLVEWKIAALPPAHGDRAMLRQAWVNLLGNAVKFTQHRTPAVIEIGATATDGETIYYVKDNGAGFEMKYVHKLFGVFQRLHTGNEFEGTGVGLALVQRIIHRHGGRVWAEGKVNEGATFCFALPEPKGES